MICPQCNKQIPDDANECGYCGAQINHKEQLSQEISYRRYQRWFFYGLIFLIFLGMVAFIVYIYNQNSQNLAQLATMEDKLKSKQEELSQKKEELQQTESELSQKESQLSQKEKELKQKTEKLQEELDSKAEIKEKYQDCQLDLDEADSNIYSLLVNLGEGVSTDKLNLIPLAEANLEGADRDGDGLSDAVEKALPSDETKADTDGDGYDDKKEILGGFDPAGEGEMARDEKFINQHKGDILLQVEDDNQAWYVSKEGKRYFMGNPANAFEVMKSVQYWSQEATSTPATATSTSTATTTPVQ